MAEELVAPVEAAGVGAAEPFHARDEIGAFALNLSTKAVLKPPHSKRWRDGLVPTNFAKRLECGAFTDLTRSFHTASRRLGRIVSPFQETHRHKDDRHSGGDVLDVHKETIAMAIAPALTTEVRQYGIIGGTVEALDKLIKKLAGGSPNPTLTLMNETRKLPSIIRPA